LSPSVEEVLPFITHNPSIPLLQQPINCYIAIS